MGETVGHDAALRLLLQPVVADRGGRGHRLIDVLVGELERAARIFAGVIGPHAGQAIGLQFDPHRHGIGVALAHVLAQLRDLARDTEQVLHVMADLVGDHVGLRELARRMEALGELVEEREVDIDALVGRAIERPHRRLTLAAGGLRGIAEQHQTRLLVLPAHLLEEVAPHVLGALQHPRDETLFRVVGRRPRRGALRALRRHVTAAAAAAATVAVDEAAEQSERIDAQNQADHDDGDQAEAALEQAAAQRDRDARAAAESAAAKATAAKATAVAAAILDVAALLAIQLHGSVSVP